MLLVNVEGVDGSRLTSQRRERVEARGRCLGVPGVPRTERGGPDLAGVAESGRLAYSAARSHWLSVNPT